MLFLSHATGIVFLKKKKKLTQSRSFKGTYSISLFLTFKVSKLSYISSFQAAILRGAQVTKQ